jgi:hypothetical protein
MCLVGVFFCNLSWLGDLESWVEIIVVAIAVIIVVIPMLFSLAVVAVWLCLSFDGR